MPVPIGLDHVSRAFTGVCVLLLVALLGACGETDGTGVSGGSQSTVATATRTATVASIAVDPTQPVATAVVVPQTAAPAPTIELDETDGGRKPLPVRRLAVAIRDERVVLMTVDGETVLRPGIVLQAVRGIDPDWDLRTYDGVRISRDEFALSASKTKPGETVVATKVSDSAQSKIWLDIQEVEFVVIPDLATQRAAYRTQQVHAVYNGPSGPPPILPEDPRTSEGISVFAFIPPAEQCVLGKDGGPGSEDFASFAGLLERSSRQIDSPFLGSDGFSLELAYQNKRDQSFRIGVHGARESTVLDHLSGAGGVCLEAIPTSGPPPEPVSPVYLAEILVDAAISVTGEPAAKLITVRDALDLKSETASLAQVLSELEGDIDAVLAVAVKQAEAQLAEALKTGGLFEYEASISVARVMEALIEQPLATFLFDSEQTPRSTQEFGEMLRENPESALIVTFDATNARESVIWVAYDPRINKYQTVDFQARCQTSVWSSLREYEGWTSLRIWQWLPYYDTIGKKTARYPDYSYTGQIYANSPTGTVAQFDAQVRAYRDGLYSISYGWHAGNDSDSC